MPFGRKVNVNNSTILYQHSVELMTMFLEILKISPNNKPSQQLLQ